MPVFVGGSIRGRRKAKPKSKVFKYSRKYHGQMTQFNKLYDRAEKVSDNFDEWMRLAKKYNEILRKSNINQVKMYDAQRARDDKKWKALKKKWGI